MSDAAERLGLSFERVGTEGRRKLRDLAPKGPGKSSE